MSHAKTLDLKGAYTAIITPFHQERVDEKALRALVERQIESGIDGLVACGTTGEAPTLSTAEKRFVIETVADQAKGRVPVIAGTGSYDTLVSVNFTQSIAEIEGVDAALVVTPYYNKPNQHGLRRHFETIANQGGLPVVLYNIPGRAGVSLSLDTIVELSKHPNIIGLKETTADMRFASDIMELVDPDFALLSGDDFTTFPFCTVGGRGCISVVSNILPAEMSEMIAATLDGDLERARKIHYKIQPLTRLLFSTTSPIPVKTIASLLGWCHPDLRLPLTQLPSHELGPYHDIIEQLELN